MLSIVGETHEALDMPRLALKQWLRHVDFAGDLGNVIAVVLPNTNREGAANVMERLMKLVRNVVAFILGEAILWLPGGWIS